MLVDTNVSVGILGNRIANSRLLFIRAALVFSGAFYFILLQSSYSFVWPYISYAGYTNYGSSLTETLIYLPACILPLLVVSLHSDKPSVYSFTFLFVALFVPILAIGPMAIDPSKREYYQTFALSSIITFLLMALQTRLKPMVFRRTVTADLNSWISYLFVSLVVFVTVQSYGIEIRSSLYSIVFDVGEQRLANRSVSIPFGFAYFVGWVTNIILPFLLVKALEAKARGAIIICVFLFILIFLATASKSRLYGILIVLSIYYTWRSQKTWSAPLVIILGFTVISTIAFVLDKLSGGVPIYSLLTVRRIAMVPGILSAYYFEYFYFAPKMWYSDSFLRGLIVNPIGSDVETMIGWKFFGNHATNANANFLANAYVQGGFIVISLVTSLYLVIMMVLDSLTRPEDRRAVATGTILLAMTLSNTSLQTTALTGGIGFLLLFTFVHKAKKSH